MLTIQRKVISLLLVVMAALSFTTASATYAATEEDLNKDAMLALQTLYKTSPVALVLSKSAKAILVFPNIIKAGLIFGGSYGEGVLLRDNKADDYYNSVTGSWGLQAGAQSYGYAVFLMQSSAVKYLKDTNGWEIGVGPTVVVVTEGVAKNLSSSTLKENAYAFIFDQQGLMVGVSIEGTKISRIKR